MINKVPFEHETPFLDDVAQGSLHAAAIDTHPAMEDTDRLQILHLLIDLLIPQSQ